MKIMVTETDILAGKKWECDNCPLAKAIKRATNNDDLAVGVKEIYHRTLVSKELIPRFIELPIDAQQFVDQFDHGFPVVPQEFEIALENEIVPEEN